MIFLIDYNVILLFVFCFHYVDSDESLIERKSISSFSYPHQLVWADSQRMASEMFVIVVAWWMNEQMNWIYFMLMRLSLLGGCKILHQMDIRRGLGRWLMEVSFLMKNMKFLLMDKHRMVACCNNSCMMNHNHILVLLFLQKWLLTMDIVEMHCHQCTEVICF